MIFCVEDDAGIRDIEVYALKSAGFEACGFEDGASFLRALEESRPQLPELVVLDVMLPGIDGLELLHMLKSSEEFRDIPVVMATAKGTEYDKITGLDSGADYYLAKPFGIMEFVSCVKVVLRRYRPKNDGGTLRCGDLVLNTDEHTVNIAGERIPLTYKEFELLKLFMSHPGTAFTRDRLFSEIWGADYCGESRTADMHIRTLRQKIGVYGDRIETVRNVGYRWEAKS